MRGIAKGCMQLVGEALQKDVCSWLERHCKRMYAVGCISNSS